MPEKTQKVLTDRFILFIDNEYLVYHHEFSQLKDKKAHGKLTEEELMKNMQKANSNAAHGTGLTYVGIHYKNSTQKLRSFLEVIEDVERVKPILTTFLYINDESIQLLVLKQFFKMEIPEIGKFKQSFIAFNSDTEFKDEVIKFPLNALTEKEREVLLPYVIRILNSKLLKKRGKANRKSVVTRRKIVYRFLANLKKEDLSIFIEQVIEPFNLTIEDTKDQAILESKLSQ